MCTIGYGNIAPATAGGKVFLIAFFVPGFSMLVTVIESLSSRVLRFVEYRCEKRHIFF